jgi:hypothetical protein
LSIHWIIELLILQKTSINRSPLIFSTDLSQLDQYYTDILTRPAIISINVRKTILKKLHIWLIIGLMKKKSSFPFVI